MCVCVCVYVCVGVCVCVCVCVWMTGAFDCARTNNLLVQGEPYDARVNPSSHRGGEMRPQISDIVIDTTVPREKRRGQV